jgi:hypothetical protein
MPTRQNAAQLAADPLTAQHMHARPQAPDVLGRVRLEDRCCHVTSACNGLVTDRKGITTEGSAELRMRLRRLRFGIRALLSSVAPVKGEVLLVRGATP